MQSGEKHRSKGVNKKLYPIALRFMKHFLQILKYIGATIIEFRFCSQVKKKKNYKNMDNLRKLLLQTLHT